jgi:DNA-binding response OmpR family regulator
LSHYYTLFDGDKIERILLNLLSNAFKFTCKDDQINLTIEKDSTSILKIIVSDTGIGMPPDVQAKIFDRFFTGREQTTVLNQGTGIGLSITKEFVKLHGGTIHVESEIGKGSVFTIFLPCEPISKSQTEYTIDSNEGFVTLLTEPSQPDKEISGTEKLTVLLIEDNDDFRNYLKDNLKSYYKIVEATNGKEGWQKALSSHPKVIVSDINMPGMDGIALSRKIKSDKRTSHIPIVLLTALTGDADQLRGLETGANDYLTKPFNFEILNIKIRNLLSLNQTLQDTYTRQLKVVPEIAVQSEDEKLLVTVIQYIESNIDSPNLTVEDLSKHVFMSRGSLYNKIVNLTGETPVEFIRSIKLNKAAALLENSDMKIAQIGYAVGFSTPNYFARAFKAKFNVSPSEYIILKKDHIESSGQAQPMPAKNI